MFGIVSTHGKPATARGGNGEGRHPIQRSCTISNVHQVEPQHREEESCSGSDKRLHGLSVSRPARRRRRPSAVRGPNHVEMIYRIPVGQSRFSSYR